MKLLRELSRQIRTKIVHPLNGCLSLRKKKTSNLHTLVQKECQKLGLGPSSKTDFYCCNSPLIKRTTRSATSSPAKTNIISPNPQLGPKQISNNFSTSCQINSSTASRPSSPLLTSLASNNQTSKLNSSVVNSFNGLGIRSMASTPVGNDEALLASARAFIPNLTNAMHKGQAGRIAIIGGSEEYTGAPYFAAISALKVGADLAHVFCVKNASPVIKSYSPELIVHPVLDSDNAVEQIMEWMPRMHCIVIGPGLGRDPNLLNVVAQLIEKLKELDKPMIIDADGLFLITSKTDLIRNYQKVILTPNSVEFSRLFSAVLGEEVKPAPSASAEKVKELAMNLGFVTILHKGATDVASNGRLIVCCAGGGSNRRCGGQGDLLAGSLSVLFHWALAYGDRGVHPAPPELLAAYGACRFAREFRAFNGTSTRMKMDNEATLNI